MTSINFNDAAKQNQQPVTISDKPSKLRPGVHKVKITGVTESPDDHIGKPFIKIGFANDDGATLEMTNYMSEKAKEWTVLKIKLVVEATEQIVPEEITIANLNTMLVGKDAMLKVSGEEIMIDDRNNPGTQVKIVVPVIEGFKFIASLVNSNLTFDANKDIKRITAEVPASDDKATNDLPF